MIPNDQYQTENWREKRREILIRDNFTCKICGTFNPSEGQVEVSNEVENCIEMHQYDSENSVYTLSTSVSPITIEINYRRGLWLVTPILQAHHRRYIQNRLAWEYENDDFICICQECHNKYHSEVEIPIYDSELNLVERKLFKPEDNNTGRKHGYRPWQFINNYSGKYVLSNVSPTMTYIALGEETINNPDLDKIADNMYSNFMKHYLPSYYKGSD